MINDEEWQGLTSHEQIQSMEAPNFKLTGLKGSSAYVPALDTTGTPSKRSCDYVLTG